MKKKINYEMLSLISSNLSTLYRDGINFLLGLELLLELPLNKGYKLTIQRSIARVSKGISLSDSFKEEGGLYPEFFIKILKVGEETGRVSEVLEGLSKYYISKYKYKRTLVINSIYPGILLIALLGFVLMFIYLIVPSFSEMLLDNKEIPYLTKKIIDLSLKLNEHKLLGIFKITIWLGAIPFILWKIKGEELLKWLKNNLKILNSKKEYEILILMNLCIEGGLSLTRGLDVFLETEQKNREILAIRNNLLKGFSISESLSKVLKLSGYSKAMINLGEESGSLEEKLKLVVSRLEEKNNGTIKIMTNLMQPAFTIVIALVILIFIGLFFFPMIDSIYSGVN